MHDLRTILAIECACGPTSVALWHNGNILGELQESTQGAQSARLMPMIQQVMQEAEMEYKAISAIATTVGPGSFTGIRVGLAAAQGISFAANVPAKGYTTLEATAFAARHQGDTVMVVLRAGKGEWYWQLFETTPAFTAITPCSVAKPETIMQAAPENVIWAGNVSHEALGIIPTAPQAATLAQLAIEKHEALPLTPLYIRPPDVSTPKNVI